MILIRSRQHIRWNQSRIAAELNQEGETIVRKVLDSLARFVVSVRTFFMVERYKDHLIVTSVTLDGGMGKYISAASISWQEDGRREMHFLRHLKDRYDNPDSARQFALAAAKNWIDDRLEKAVKPRRF